VSPQGETAGGPGPPECVVIVDGSTSAMAPNPLRSEAEAFRVFLYVLAVFAVALVVALIIQAF
jgi:hypothetical protein